MSKTADALVLDKPPAAHPAPPKVNTTVPLTQAQIESRLQLVNPELAKEVLDFAKAQVQAEGTRHTMLNTKAMAIVTAAGISMSVTFTVATALASGKVVVPVWLIGTFAAAGLVGIATVALGVRALLVKDGFALVSDHAVFDEKALAFADAPTGCEDLKEPKDKYAYGVAAYRQHMAVHLWSVAAQDHEQLDRKASEVYHSQVCFIAFVCLILACEICLFGVISSQTNDAREAAAASSAAAKGPQGVTTGRQGNPSAVASGPTPKSSAPTP